MNKSEFVAALAERIGITKTDAQNAVDGVLGTISDELSAGGTVEFAGWGKFSVKQTVERQGRNPSTGAAITIPAAAKPVWTPGKTLKDRLKK